MRIWELPRGAGEKIERGGDAEESELLLSSPCGFAGLATCNLARFFLGKGCHGEGSWES